MNAITTNNIRRKIGVLLRYLLLAAMALVSLAPIIWVFLSAFKTNTEIITNSFGLPHEWVTKNIVRVFTSRHLLSGYYNTLLSVVFVLALTVLFGSMTSYVSSRLSKGAGLQTYYAMGIMIPMQTILIPTFLILQRMGLVYTRPGIILSYVAATMPITVFILHGFMKGIPHEVEEAAVIDGATLTRCFFSIILPMSKPGIATVLTLNLLTVWNDYLFSLVIGGPGYYNITVVINNFKGQPDTAIEYGMVCAGLMFSILPLAVLYICMQNSVIKGMAEGAIKA